MNRAATLLLLLLASSQAAQAKDLVGVFEDAVHNDPVIRQADANRLAAREARPQAWSALLPQLNGTAGVTGEHNSGTTPLETANPNGPGATSASAPPRTGSSHAAFFASLAGPTTHVPSTGSTTDSGAAWYELLGGSS